MGASLSAAGHVDSNQRLEAVPAGVLADKVPGNLPASPSRTITNVSTASRLANSVWNWTTSYSPAGAPGRVLVRSTDSTVRPATFPSGPRTGLTALAHCSAVTCERKIVAALRQLSSQRSPSTSAAHSRAAAAPADSAASAAASRRSARGESDETPAGNPVESMTAATTISMTRTPPTSQTPKRPAPCRLLPASTAVPATPNSLSPNELGVARSASPRSLAASRLLDTPSFRRQSRRRSLMVCTDRPSSRAIDFASWPASRRRSVCFSRSLSESSRSCIPDVGKAAIA